MVSNRYRSERSLGTKINSLDSKTKRNSKSATNPHIDGGSLGAGLFANEAVTSDVLAPESVNSEKIQNGAVGTNELGVVNEIVADSPFNIQAPSVTLNGVAFPRLGDTSGMINDLQLPGRLRESNNLGAGADPNNLIYNGWYSGYNWAGSLAGFGIGVLHVQQYSPDWIVQTLTSVEASPRVFMRTRHSGTTWTTWRMEDTGWISWVPSVSNMTLGSGSVFGRYRRSGKTVEVFNRFTLGSGSAMGTTPIFGLPFGAASPGNPVSLFTEMLDSGSAYYVGSGLLNSTYVTMYFHQTFGSVNGQVMGNISAAQPFTWASGDSISCRVIYETNE